MIIQPGTVCRYTVLRPRFSTEAIRKNAKPMKWQTSAVFSANSPERCSWMVTHPDTVCRYTVLRPRFSTEVVGKDAKLVGYQTSAILPNNSPVRIAQGQIMRTRALAQASASLEACRQLHQVCFPHSLQLGHLWKGSTHACIPLCSSAAQ